MISWADFCRLSRKQTVTIEYQLLNVISKMRTLPVLACSRVLLGSESFYRNHFIDARTVASDFSDYSFHLFLIPQLLYQSQIPSDFRH